MEVDFSEDVFEWRGPAPYYYVVVPDDESDEIKEAPPMLNYGWGVIPAQVVVGDTEWATSEFPRTVATWCRSRTCVDPSWAATRTIRRYVADH